ncbi:MAG: STAS domain-containing protein [Hymenobacteraceae bacterium]|nr:STAS domain-containing protein [Hymenobacteraceae bacterium]
MLPAMPFAFDSRVREGVLHLTLAGDLLGDTDSDAVLRLAEAHISTGTILALADLSGIRFLNSSGLSVLIGLLTRFRNAGGELLLVNPSAELRKLLVITRLEAIFTLAPDLPTAEQRLRVLAS